MEIGSNNTTWPSLERPRSQIKLYWLKVVIEWNCETSYYREASVDHKGHHDKIIQWRKNICPVARKNPKTGCKFGEDCQNGCGYKISRGNKSYHNPKLGHKRSVSRPQICLHKRQLSRPQNSPEKNRSARQVARTSTITTLDLTMERKTVAIMNLVFGIKWSAIAKLTLGRNFHDCRTTPQECS